MGLLVRFCLMDGCDMRGVGRGLSSCRESLEWDSGFLLPVEEEDGECGD